MGRSAHDVPSALSNAIPRVALSKSMITRSSSRLRSQTIWSASPTVRANSKRAQLDFAAVAASSCNSMSRVSSRTRSDFILVFLLNGLEWREPCALPKVSVGIALVIVQRSCEVCLRIARSTENPASSQMARNTSRPMRPKPLIPILVIELNLLRVVHSLLRRKVFE